MAFLSTRLLRAAATRLPFILLGSPPLRQTSALFESDASQPVKPAEISRQLNENATPPRASRFGAAGIKSKDAKKRSFNAVIRWCAYHQDTTVGLPLSASSSATEDSVAAMDDAVLRWVQATAHSFSCSQSLIVLTFLCDVALRLARAPVAPGATERKRDDRVGDLVGCIALVLEHAASSRHLGLQPFTVLLSAAYALDRVTHGNPLQLPPATLASILMPDAVWLALVHQTSGHIAEVEATPPGAEDGTHMETVLTAMLVFDAARCSRTMAGAEAKVLLPLMRAFVRLAKEQVWTVRQQRRDAADVLTARLSELASVGAPDRIESPDKAMVGDSFEDAAASLALIRPAAARATIGIFDCERMLCNMQVAPASDRAMLTEYLLLVARDPGAYSADDMRQLPRVLAAALASVGCRNAEIADVLLANAAAAPLEALLCLLPYVKRKGILRPRVTALLEDHVTRHAAAPLAGSASDEQLSPTAARMVLSSLGLHLPWHLGRHLLVRMFAEYPDLHAAMLAALEQPRGSRADEGDDTAAPSGEGAGGETKLLLSDEVGAAVVFLSEAPHRAALLVGTDAAQQQAREEMRVLTKLLVCRLDWPKMATAAPRGGVRNPGIRMSTHAVRFAALQLYVEDRLDHHHLREEETISDATLLYGYVLPALRAVQSRTSRFATLSRVLSVLRDDASRRQLLGRLLSSCAECSGCALRGFVCYLAVPAADLKATSAAFTKVLFRQRILVTRGFKNQCPASADALKVHTIALSRVLRYAVAVNAFGGTNPDTTATRHEMVRRWVEHYIAAVVSAENSAALDAADAESSNATCAATASLKDGADEHLAAAGEEAASLAGELGDEDAEGEAEEAPVLCDGVGCDADKIFTTPVTTADVEEVLSLMLQVGCGVPHRSVQTWARCFFKSHAVELEDLMRDGNGGAWPSTDDQTEVYAAKPPVLETVAGGVEDGLAAAPSQQLLPAHFVWLVRADSCNSLRPSPRLLRSLLWRSELSIFSHVFSALLQAFKRTRTSPQLHEDLHLAVASFIILHARLTEAAAPHDLGQGSSVVQATVTALLRHLGHTKVYTTSAMQEVFRPNTALRDADVRVAKGSEEDSVVSDATSELPVATSATTAAPDDAELVAESAVAEGDEVDDMNSAPELVALHAQAEAAVLRTLPFLEPAHAKLLALSELRRLAFFLPRVAPFLMHQLQPQLGNFSPRELLLLASQYPAAAADVLTCLAASDMRLTVDLAEYVPLARHLPAAVNDAVVRAHLPQMTLSWVTRVLSALSAHQEVSLPLLTALVERAQATVDEGSESDKSLLLMVLQAYLGSSPAAATLQPAQGATAEDSEDLRAAEVLAGPQVSAPALLGAAERAARLELVRACCDRVLSLEHIATLEALRFFLVGYPPSLYEMRERGVVAKVEQRLLPEVLGASPPKWRDLGALVQLLAEHHVLLPSTVRQVVESTFTEPTLRSIYAASASSSDSDVVEALTSLLQVAATCVLAGTATAPRTHSAAVLEPLLAVVLRVFDGTQHWLAALGNVLASPTAPPAVEAAARHMCAALLQRGAALTPSEFARLVHFISRVKAWDLALASDSAGGSASGGGAAFDSTFASCYGRADAHSRCVLLRAIATETAVLRRFEDIVFLPMHDDVALLSSEDLELVLAAVQQVSSELVAEPVLDVIDTRLLPMIDQCRRSALVRLLQCHTQFGIRDEAVVTAALLALERQSTSEVKLDVVQVLAVLQSMAKLCETRLPSRLVVMCFQRLEKSVTALTPVQQYQVGRLILDLEMGFIPSVSALVLHILDSRDSARGHSQFQAMAEELCSVFEVELPPTLRASRLRKQMHKQRVQDFWSAQRRVKQQALLHYRLSA